MIGSSNSSHREESPSVRGAHSSIIRIGVLILFFGVACATTGDSAIRRASREFSCPEEKIGLIERADISDNLYDIEACGHRARYLCIISSRGVVTACMREPDPPKWDPDPKDVASLPEPQSPKTEDYYDRRLRSSSGEARRICHDQDDFERYRDCILLH
jgi:hypothetical protein